MSFAFVSSIFSTIYADAPAEEPKEQKEEKEPAEDNEEGSENVVSGVTEKSTEDSEASTADEEEDEPQDLHPIIREECQQSAKCAPLTKHYLHCQEKVHAGEGYHGEDCVEELCAYQASMLRFMF